MNEIKVSQQAREAANNWIRTAPLAVKMAGVNPTLLYEAFARFEQAIRADERERAAKEAVGADGGAEGYCGPHWRCRQRTGDDGADGRVQELNKISGAQP